MKSCFLSLLACVFAFCCLAQSPRICSPRTRILMQQWRVGTSEPIKDYVWVRDEAGQWRVKAWIQTDPGSAADLQQSLRQLGVSIGTKAGSVWTAAIRPDQLSAAASLKGIRYLDVDQPIHLLMDSARRATHVDSAHAGYLLPFGPFTGKDVVVGIIDAGFDYRHPAFFDSLGTRYRIRRVWQQKNSSGTPPAGFSYGTEIVDSLAMWAQGSDMPISHGTHVAGIAAGSGRGGDSTHRAKRGMAYDADLVMVGITPSPQNWLSTGMTDVIDGMNYIYNYAASVGKPAVANLSWGCSMGPHDGSSLFSQACDALTGAGKIFTVSAGNNGDEGIHVTKAFNATDTLLNTFITFDGGLAEKRAWVDVWGDSAASFCISLTAYGSASAGATTGYICLDDSIHTTFLIGSDGDTLFATVATEQSSFNGKPRALLQLYSKTLSPINLTIAAQNGTVHAWNGYVSGTTGYYGAFSNGGFSWAQNGDSRYTLGDMATTRTAISVAAYASKVKFKNLAGSQVSYTNYVVLGNRAAFSSRGPIVGAAYMKPDIAGPGMSLASAVNSYDGSMTPAGASASLLVAHYLDAGNNRDYYYGQLSGTSMSAPAAAGIIALMLQADPTLTPSKVQLLLRTTAIKDSWTGLQPDSTLWGAGKINGFRALLATWPVGIVGGPLMAKVDRLEIFPNPTTQGTFSVNASFGQAGIARCTLLSEAGVPVWADSWVVSKGKNEKTCQADVPAGFYMLVIRLNDEWYQERLVILK